MNSLALIVLLPLLAAAALAAVPRNFRVVMRLAPLAATFLTALLEIGRASCRERV